MDGDGDEGDTDDALNDQHDDERRRERVKADTQTHCKRNPPVLKLVDAIQETNAKIQPLLHTH